MVVRLELNILQRGVDKTSSAGDNGGLDETAFFAGEFKGRCNLCGKYGHKATIVPKIKIIKIKEINNIIKEISEISILESMEQE